MPEVGEKYEGCREQNQVLKNIAKRGQREAASRQNRYRDVDATRTAIPSAQPRPFLNATLPIMRL